MHTNWLLSVVSDNNILYFLQDLKSTQINIQQYICEQTIQLQHERKHNVYYIYTTTWDDFITHEKFLISKDYIH